MRGGWFYERIHVLSRTLSIHVVSKRIPLLVFRIFLVSLNRGQVKNDVVADGINARARGVRGTIVDSTVHIGFINIARRLIPRKH